MANKGSRHLNSFANDVFDETEYRNRVATYVDGNSVSYEDANFLVADGAAVLNIEADLGRIGHKGHVINDGPGRLRVEVSSDGTTYGGLHTLSDGDVFSLDDLTIKKIRITPVEVSAYRALIA